MRHHTSSARSFGGYSILGMAYLAGLAQMVSAADSTAVPAPVSVGSAGPVQPIQNKDQIMTTPDYTGDLADRSTMTGDWAGTRQELANHGVTLDGYLTQVTQGVVSGGREAGWEYMGRGEADLNIDTAKLGAWPGGLFTVIGEGNYGNGLAKNTGTLLPVNSNSLYPEPTPDFSVPEVAYTQFLSPQIGFSLGKLATVTASSGDMNEFAHGKGDQQFLNTSFGFNPILALTVPYSTLGLAVIGLPSKDFIISGAVLDPQGKADNAGFGDFFTNGATLSLWGRYTVHYWDLTGHQLLGGTYSTSSYTDLDQRAANLIIPGLPVSKADNSWCVYYNGDQYLYQPDPDKDQGWGIFGRLGLSDGIANPIKWFGSIGFGAKGVLPGRPYDQAGIGYYYAGISNAEIPSNLKFNDAQGVEAYYQFAITRWCQLSPDIQWVLPSSEHVSESWVLGVRLNLVF